MSSLEQGCMIRVLLGLYGIKRDILIKKETFAKCDLIVFAS